MSFFIYFFLFSRSPNKQKLCVSNACCFCKSLCGPFSCAFLYLWKKKRCEVVSGIVRVEEEMERTRTLKRVLSFAEHLKFTRWMDPNLKTTMPFKLSPSTRGLLLYAWNKPPVRIAFSILRWVIELRSKKKIREGKVDIWWW